MRSSTLSLFVNGARYRLVSSAKAPEPNATALKGKAASVVIDAAVRSSARGRLIELLPIGVSGEIVDDAAISTKIVAMLDSSVMPLTLYRLWSKPVTRAERSAHRAVSKSPPEPASPPEQVASTKTSDLRIELNRAVTCAPGQKAPAEGARIKLSGQGVGRQESCNAEGKALFPDLPLGSYELEMELEHYEPLEQEVTLTNEFGERFEFELTRNSSWDLTMIPAIMDHKGWSIGARLMREWFSRKSYTYGNPDEIDTTAGIPYDATIVTLDWVKGFERAKAIYDAMWNNKIYANKAARAELQKVLLVEGMFDHRSTVKFGDLSRPVDELNRSPYFIQNRTHEQSKTAAFDGLAAALANFNFRMAVEGTVTFKSAEDPSLFDWDGESTYVIEVTKVGLYVRDSYDFIDGLLPQPLGAWNPDTNEARHITNDDGYHSVWNSDFRKWRARYGCGGDFMVFSDVETRAVAETWEFTLD